MPPVSNYQADGLQAVAPDGIGTITPGTDLARVIALTAATADWPDGTRGITAGDVVVVTSKAVAKAEGQVRPASQRAAAAAEQTAEVITQVPDGPAIVRNHHGVVLAAAGIDESNTDSGTVVLLPADPDESAARLKADLERALAVAPLGVVISDTLGRAWRLGQLDTAIGVAGLPPLVDLAGSADASGRTLAVSAPAIADEVAGLADLVKGKAAGRPVAFLRGLAHLVSPEAGPGASQLVRPAAQDRFRRGADESYRAGLQDAVRHRRTVRQFTSAAVPADLIAAAVAEAVNAPAPHHTTPWRFAHVRGRARTRLLDAMADQWRRDLAELDGFTPQSIARRVRRGDVLRDAPELVVPFVALADNAHSYPDRDRRGFERDLFVLSGGAAVQNFMIAVAARGAATAWVSSTVFCPDVVRRVLDLPPDWQPLGGIAVGYAQTPPTPRPTRDPATFLRTFD